MQLADRMAHLGTESAFAVLAKAKELEAKGQHIVHLEIGEPDFATSAHIVEAGIEALHAGATHYTPSAGIPELREAIAAESSQRRGMNWSPAQVVVTPGAKPIMFFALLALVNPGDEVVFPDPGFPIYQSVVEFIGAKPAPIPLLEDQDFVFDVERLRKAIGPKTRMIILNSPQNPTGGILNRHDLEVIAELAEEHDCWILSDEIYGRLLYEGEHVSIATLPDMQRRTIVLDGFSKTYAMTGWRLGYGLMPQRLAEEVAKLMVNSASCTAAFTQYAGIAALRGSQQGVDEMLAEFRARRELLISGLNAIPGITCRWPKGAFYAFPNVTALGLTSQQLADRLLTDYGIASLAGSSFGAAGEGYIRLSYANSQDNLREAMRRIGQAVADLTRG
jgi:aspartate/methionine/tyrosine aminotransferase